MDSQFSSNRLFQPDSQASQPSANEGSNSEPLGQAPPDVANLFQSQSSILLKPGEVQLDIGFVYSWQEATGLVLLPGNALALQRVRDRRFLMPLNLRYGYKERVELFLFAPFGFAALEQSDPANLDTDTQGGVGDLRAGFMYQLRNQKGAVPDVTMSLSFAAPTGGDPFTASANLPSIGNGFWDIAAQLNFVRSLDPVVFFGGVGFLHQFGDTFNGVLIQPGEVFDYSFGMGFAVSDDVALSVSLNGYLQMRTAVDRALIANSSQEPTSLRLSCSRRTSKHTRMQPFVDFGLNDDAVDFEFGVIFTRDLRKYVGEASP